MTGFWRLPGEVRRRIGEAEPEDLAGWLAAGPPPVFIGFGSMPVLEPEMVIDMVAEAARLTGLRIVIGKGWSDLPGLAAASLPDNLWLTGAVNHDWLFPQCRAVIHHGGVGTTAAGLIAGRATWIFSVFADQPFWGHRVARLGVGGYNQFVDFDLSHLTFALGELMREDVQQRASALGERLRTEDGLAEAVRLIEKIAG
jgi:sterol 3beta-glucosyltransferase